MKEKIKTAFNSVFDKIYGLFYVLYVLIYQRETINALKVSKIKDSLEAINWSIEKINPGGKVYIPANGPDTDNNWEIDSEIVVENKTGITIQGDGFGTVLKPTGDVSSVMRIGHRTDAGKSCTEIIVRDLKIDGSNQSTATDGPENVRQNLGIDLESPANETKDCVVENCYVYNTGNDGIYGYLTGKNYVRNNIVDSVRNWWGGIHNHGDPRNWEIIGNIVRDCTNTSQGIRHGEILIGNYVYNCGTSAGLLGHNIIVGNIVEGAPRDGIMNWTDKDALIALNRVENAGRFGIITTNQASIIANAVVSSGGTGISCNPAPNAQVIANRVIDAGARGILMAEADNFQVLNNIVDNPADLGIWIFENDGGTYENFMVSNNRVFNAGNDGLKIVERAGGVLDYYLVSDNILRGNTGTNLNDAAAGANALVTDNIS